MTRDRKLPEGWRWVRFGDVVRQVKEKVDPETAGIERYIAGEHMDTDDLRLRRWGEIGDGYLGPAFHMRFEPGHVLYGSRRTYLRKVAVADFEGICANTTFVVEPSGDELLPEFLPLVMTTEAFHNHSIKQSKGSVNPYINFKDLTWYEFGLPPQEEQSQVAEVVREIDGVVDAYARAEPVAEELRDALIIDASSEADERATLGALGAVVRGRRFPSEEVLPTGDLPFLKVADLGEQLDGQPVSTARHYVPGTFPEVVGIRPVPAGAVLFQRVGASLRSDRKWLLGTDALIDENILAFVPARPEWPDLLIGLVSQVSVLGLLQEGTVPSINERLIRGIEVPVLTERRATVLNEQLCELRLTRAGMNESQQAARRLSGSLRESLLRGDRRVQ